MKKKRGISLRGMPPQGWLDAQLNGSATISVSDEILFLMRSTLNKRKKISVQQRSQRVRKTGAYLLKDQLCRIDPPES